MAVAIRETAVSEAAVICAVDNPNSYTLRASETDFLIRSVCAVVGAVVSAVVNVPTVELTTVPVMGRKNNICRNAF